MTVLFSWLVALLLVCSICANELGNRRSTLKSHDGLFREIDLDDNGRVSKEEMDVFVVGTGGESFDEQYEIDNAVDSIMEALDENNDTSLKLNEFSAYWDNIASLLSSEEVLSWIEHSLQLPQSIVEVFAKNGITSHDFTELLENDGALIESDLAIDTPGVKRKLMRGMKMVLFGMSHPPSPPSSLKTRTISASSIAIEWNIDEQSQVTTHRSPSQITSLDTPYIDTYAKEQLPQPHGIRKNEPTQEKSSESHITNSMVLANSPSRRFTTRVNKDTYSIPIHKYILQRRVMNVHTISPATNTQNWDWLNPLKASKDGGFATDSSQFSLGKWVTIYDGLDTSYTDINLAADTRYKYRIVSWNTFGHSKYVEFESRTFPKSAGKSSNSELPDLYDLYLQETTFGRIQLILRYLMSAIYDVLTGLLTAIQLFGLVTTFVGVLIRYKWMGEDHPISPFFWKLWGFMNSVFNFICHYGSLLTEQEFPHCFNLYNDIERLRLADDEGVITPGAVGIRPTLPRVASNASIASSTRNSSDTGFTLQRQKSKRSVKFVDDNSAKPSAARANASNQYCSACSKSFSVMKGRAKHHCGHCGVLFCSKHAGHVSHSFYVPCAPILGSCLCVSCNNKLKEEHSLRQTHTN